jgi:hypothetical protein
MKNKVESLKGHNSIEANEMMSSARQQNNEPLAEYYKRFTSCVDVGESEWGTPVPTQTTCLKGYCCPNVLKQAFLMFKAE